MVDGMHNWPYGYGPRSVQPRTSTCARTSVTRAYYSPSAIPEDTGIHTLDFLVPAGKGKDPHRMRHKFKFPEHLQSSLAYFQTSKVIYHGSDWLEIDQVISQGYSLLGSKIFTSALKPGLMNDIRWDLMLSASSSYSCIEVSNPRPREGHFKMSLMGKWSIP